MPFKSDKQRRYLWSQKPEVAKKFAQHHQEGGAVPPGFYQQRAEFSRLVDEGVIDQKDMLRWEMVDKLKQQGLSPVDAAFKARAMYKESGGGVYSSGIYDDSAKWWNRKIAGVPQHVGFIDDPDDITETAATNPDDPYGGRFINPDRRAPLGRYTDLATYYTAKQRDMGRGKRELARMAEHNQRLKEEAAKRGFVFKNAGGKVGGK